MADDNADRELRKTLHMIQSMIDVSTQRLEGLRTQCATNAELTQQEMRSLEGKLITMLSEQLSIKSKIKKFATEDRVPSLRQWLHIFGLDATSSLALITSISSMEELRDTSETNLKSILEGNTEDFQKLCRALKNLRRCLANHQPPSDLHWDSWTPHHHHHHHQSKSASAAPSPRPSRSRAARASVSGEDSLLDRIDDDDKVRQTMMIMSTRRCATGGVDRDDYGEEGPLTPTGFAGGSKGRGARFPTTPPARRRHRTGVAPSLLAEYPLTKSKSHESQLAGGSKSEGGDGKISNGTGSVGRRRGRLPTEPGPSTTMTGGGFCTPSATSPVKSPPYNHNNVSLATVPTTTVGALDADEMGYKSVSHLQVPKSPRTPTVLGKIMTHQINHRFTKTFKMMSSCGFCQKPIYLGTGLKCKECKYTCHRECEDKVTPSCGLPPELLNEFKKNFTMDGVTAAGGSAFASPTASISRASGKKIVNSLTRNKQRKNSHPQLINNTSTIQPPDSSSNTSSCNSSTPSSPAVQVLTTPHSSHKSTFHFPDVTVIEPRTLTPSSFVSDTTTSTSIHELPSGVDRNSSVEDETTPTPMGVRVDSQDSQEEEGTRWPRQNSLSMREWDIPFDELKTTEIIGTGRFGTVFRGRWHGDVAVKVLHVDYLQESTVLEQFKREVTIFRKTRHENVILFMGACMQPPKLAIVTSLSKGMSLFTHIHLRKDKFNMNKTTNLAQQISQGMGYLHAKGIVHKDLKSKNIFVENGKVVITDFGLFSVTKLCFGNRSCDSLGIPPGWLCYLAPEIMRSLHAHRPHDEDLPFTNASDVYAFGTVWYELLCGEWPFKGQSPEAVIWQVGKGVKQPLANLQASRDVKDILMLCWSFRADDRPDFVRLLNILEKLPKKRLARSPSHPIHLSRSAESVF